MRALGISFILLLLAAPALRAQDPPDELREDVWGVSSGDPGMDCAIARARETLPVFHGYLPRARAGEVQLKLKARFSQGAEVEHMWISGVTWDGAVYRGVLESRPLGLTNVRAGEAVTIRPGQVSDWMVVERGDVMLGNFTTMHLRSRMKPQRRAELDRTMGYRILADTAIVRLPPRSDAQGTQKEKAPPASSADGAFLFCRFLTRCRNGIPRHAEKFAFAIGLSRCGDRLPGSGCEQSSD